MVFCHLIKMESPEGKQHVYTWGIRLRANNTSSNEAVILILLVSNEQLMIKSFFRCKRTPPLPGGYHVCVKGSQILQCSKNIILVDTVKLKVQCKLQLEYTVRYSRNFHLYTGQQNLPRNYCSCLFFEACHLNFLSFATAWEVNFELFVQHFFLSAERVRKEIIIH